MVTFTAFIRPVGGDVCSERRVDVGTNFYIGNAGHLFGSKSGIVGATKIQIELKKVI